MSKSTNTKDELPEELDDMFYRYRVSTVNGERRNIEQEIISFVRQQLIQRIKEEVIGEDEYKQGNSYKVKDMAIANRDYLRQTQREILETMEK